MKQPESFKKRLGRSFTLLETYMVGIFIFYLQFALFSMDRLFNSFKSFLVGNASEEVT